MQNYKQIWAKLSRNVGDASFHVCCIEDEEQIRSNGAITAVFLQDVLRITPDHKVLEIGCGTGQLLACLAPATESYYAADISEVAIEALRKNIALPQVTLLRRPADDFSYLPAAYFDTLILNSVVQYFPNAAYLRNVLT